MREKLRSMNRSLKLKWSFLKSPEGIAGLIAGLNGVDVSGVILELTRCVLFLSAMVPLERSLT